MLRRLVLGVKDTVLIGKVLEVSIWIAPDSEDKVAHIMRWGHTYAWQSLTEHLVSEPRSPMKLFAKPR